MENKIKNKLIIALLAIVVILSSIIAYMIIARKEQLNILAGTVIVSTKNYIIVSSEDEDYLIYNVINDAYDIGDKLEIRYKEKNIDKSESPYSIKTESIKLIQKIENDNEEESTTKNEIDTSKKPTNEDVSIPPTNKPSQGEDDKQTVDKEVLAYFEKLKNEFDSSMIKDGIKNGFTTVVDFLFYGEAIGGHTFKELSDGAKLKVLEMALYFDEKIDKYFPGYKESISTSSSKVYTTIKNEIVSTYLNVTTKVCEKDEELCKNAKSGFDTIKKNFGLTWSLIKEIAGDGISNLKNWYEIWSGK